jgi:uncharacterized protein YgiM (DUF1202 family)
MLILTIGCAIFSFALWLPTRGFAQETLYVKADGTELRAEDSARARIIGKLNKGTPVRVLATSDKFVKVSANGKEGWVFKFKLSGAAPDNTSLGEILGGRQKMVAAESSSASSIRGLSPASENYAKTKGISAKSIAAVSQMELLEISRDEFRDFLKAGKLGEFASR